MIRCARPTSGLARFIILAALTSIGSGCTSSPSPTGPSGSTSAPVAGAVTVAASPASLPSGGGTTTITATVTSAAGNPLQTIPVAFTTTAGTVTPASAKTDAKGVVQATLSTTGNATVTAETAGSSGPISKSVPVSIAAPPQPLVSIAPSASPVAGKAMTFTIIVTPAAGITIQNVQVTFGDSTAAVNLGAVTGTTSVSHVYATAKTYTASVTVTASGAGPTSTTASTPVVVGAPGAPAVSVTASAGAVEGTTTALTITVTPASGTTILSVVINYGDGQEDALGPINGNVTRPHVYKTAGTYPVNVTATAVGGVSATGSTVVVVASPPVPGAPSVSVTASAAPVAGTAMTFSITVTPASGTTIKGVVINYGDGSEEPLGPITGSVTRPHVYASAGTYPVLVTATGDGGVKSTASTAVVVATAPLPCAPTVSVTASAAPIAGTTMTFTITITPAPGTAIKDVVINYGDGREDVLGPITGSVTRPHVYVNAGTYAVNVTATAVGEVSATGSAAVVVGPVPGSVTLTKSPKGGTYTYGSNPSFTIVVASTGSGTARNVVLTDPLPTVGNLNSWVVTSNPGGCAITSNVLNCSFGDLATGQTRTVTVATNAPGGADATACPAGPLTNTASLASTGLPAMTDAGSYTCTGCAPETFVYTVSTFVRDTLQNWPGGTRTFGSAFCAVTAAAPIGDIRVPAAGWGIQGAPTGFGSCALEVLLPVCRTLGGSPGIDGTRPTCSNSSDVFSSGASTASANIKCVK